VLDGTVRSKLAGQPLRRYRQGEFWVEPPGTDHQDTANASGSDSARLLVVFICDTGAKLKVDDPPPSPDDDRLTPTVRTHD
jgi:quercetin dioxygenase-like cupin family protein